MNPSGAGAGNDRRYSLLPNSSAIAHSAAPPLHGFTGNLSMVPPSPSLYALESSRKLEEEVRRELDPLRACAMAERLREVQLLGLLPPTANGTPTGPPAPEPTLGHGPYLLPYSSPYPTSHRNDIEDRVAVAGPSPSYSVSDPDSDDAEEEYPQRGGHSELRHSRRVQEKMEKIKKMFGQEALAAVSDPDSDDAEEEYPPRGGHSELRPSRRVQEKMEKIKKMFGQEVLAAPLEEKEAPPPAGGHCYRCGRDGHVLTTCDLSNQDILGYKQQGMNGERCEKRVIKKRKSKKRKSRWEESV